MHKPQLTAAINAMIVAGFANTNAGSKLYICSTTQPADLDATAFAALTWVQIKGVGSHGETGSKTNILNYDTWDTKVTQKAKGIVDAGSPEIELARISDDAGQVLLRTAAKTNTNYAFKMERNDKPNSNVGSKPTTIFNRGLVSGPRRPNGKNEDFDLEIFMLGLQQEEIVVDPVTA